MIAQKLRMLRKTSGLTQVQLAKKLNVAQSLVQRWESGKKAPNFETMKKFSNIFNVSLDVLAFSEKEINSFKGQDKSILSKLQNFEKLSEEDKVTVANLISSLAQKKA